MNGQSAAFGPKPIIMIGDAIEQMRLLSAESINCVVTSPPYFGLRDYGVAGQIGLEPTPDAYVVKMVAVFREVRRVLRPDGTLWLNLGDSYARAPAKGGSGPAGKNEDRWGYGDANKKRVKNQNSKQATNHHSDLDGLSRISKMGSSDGGVGRADRPGSRALSGGLDAKQLLGIPWRVAFALQADGWYLRQDIIWSKPNPMPESVRDRCTKAHEYIFMLSKSARYYYDADAIAEDAIYSGLTGQDASGFKNASNFKGKNSGGNSVRGERPDKQRGHSRRHDGFNDRWDAMSKAQQCSGKRNKRSVWTVAPKPFSGAHFATFPPDLIRPCIRAGCPVGGVVLDPFFGSGTTGLVAQQENRRSVGVEINEKYVEIARDRIGLSAEDVSEGASQFIESAKEVIEGVGIGRK